MAGPDTVAGVTARRAEGFTPIEDLTGMMEIATVWPEEHRCSVTETRPWWVDDQPDGRLWLVRSPWQSLSVQDALTVVWSFVERDRDAYLVMDERTRLATIGDVLAWTETRAQQQLRAFHERTD